MRYFAFHIGDYARSTGHLTLLEDAIYMRLLRRYYAQEAPIDGDLEQVCRWVGARSDSDQAAVESVLLEFFELDDGRWHNRRADREIRAMQDKSEKAAASARKRWEKAGNADAMRSHSEGNATQYPIPNTHNPKGKGASPPGAQRRKFRPPTLQEVTDHIAEKQLQVDPVRFIAHYEANGWRVGRNPMKSWQAALVSWATRKRDQGGGGGARASPGTRGTPLIDDLTDTSWAD